MATSLSNVFVIGAGGLIGSSIVSRDASTDSNNYNSATLDWGSIHSNDLYSISKLIDQLKLAQINNDFPPYIIWAAGKTVVRANKANCDLEFYTTRLIIEKVLERISFNLIYLSSGGSLFNSSDIIRFEDATPNPNSYYGEMKLRTENFLLETFEHLSCKLSIVRLPNVYGAAQDKTKSQGLVTKLIELNTQDEFEPYFSLDSRKNYVSSQDVGKFIRFILSNREWMLKGNRVLHFPARNNAYSIGDIINLIKLYKEIKVRSSAMLSPDTVLLDSNIRDLYPFDLKLELSEFISQKLG